MGVKRKPRRLGVNSLAWACSSSRRSTFLARAFLARDLDLTIREASNLAARGSGHGIHLARNLRRWIRAFRADGALPTHFYGRFNTSRLAHEDVASAIHLHLMSIAAEGKYIRAQDVVDFVQSDPDIHTKLGGKVKISVRTARRWMCKMKWRYTKTSKSTYIDGHERADVVA